VIGRVPFTTIDANDPDRLAAFWGEVLGTEIEETSDDGRFVFLGEANGFVLSGSPQPRSSGLVRHVGPPSPFREISPPG
jgi:predicted enzyme related to lactoylglutathione lyase